MSIVEKGKFKKGTLTKTKAQHFVKYFELSWAYYVGISTFGKINSVLIMIRVMFLPQPSMVLLLRQKRFCSCFFSSFFFVTNTNERFKEHHLLSVVLSLLCFQSGSTFQVCGYILSV